MASMIVRVADLREQVYETLKARITNGGFDVDTKFQEINLAQDLGVSRTPVREALAMLVRDGLLVQATRGFRFRRFTMQEIADVTEVRLQLEPHAVETMIAGTDAEELRSLAGFMEREIRKAGDSPAYTDAHRRVREAIFSRVRNVQLVEAINRYEDSIHYLRVNTLQDSGMRRRSMEGMLRLAAAIGGGDARTAREQMAQQLIMAREAFSEWLVRNEGEDGA